MSTPRTELSTTTGVRLPQHVVYRVFPAETVVLNLDTGTYHSTNPVGGRFLEALERDGTIGGALEQLCQQFEDEDPKVIGADLQAFCVDLSERGLLEIKDA